MLVMDGLVEFSAGFVLDLDRAWQVAEEFARTGDAVRAGDWHGGGVCAGQSGKGPLVVIRPGTETWSCGPTESAIIAP